MILINLLPHREERRKRRQQAYLVGLGLAVLGGVLIAGVWYGILQQMISSQQDRNTFLRAEITKLDEQIKDVATLKAEIEALKARQTAVENLQTDRNMPVHLLNELVGQTPEGVYLSSIRQDGEVVAVQGFAQSNERVSEFLRKTANESAWLSRPELVEIKAATAQAAKADSRRLYDFTVKLSLKRPQPAAGAASAPAAPARAAKKS